VFRLRSARPLCLRSRLRVLRCLAGSVGRICSHAEAQVVEPVHVAIRRTAVPGVVPPAAASDHPAAGRPGVQSKATELAQWKTGLASRQDLLLNADLAGTIDEPTYQANSTEFKVKAANADEAFFCWPTLPRPVANRQWPYSTRGRLRRTSGAAQAIAFGASYSTRFVQTVRCTTQVSSQKRESPSTLSPNGRI